MHDKGGEQAVHTATAVSNVPRGCDSLVIAFVLHESGRVPQLIVVLQGLHYRCDHTSGLVRNGS